MDKRFFFFVALSISTLFVFQYFNKNSDLKDNKIPTDVRPGQGYRVPTSQDLARPINTEIDFVDKKVTQKENFKYLETDLYKVSFSDYGAVIADLDYKKHFGKNGLPLRTIHHKGFFNREDGAFLLALEEKTPYFYKLDNVNNLDDKIEVSYKTTVDDLAIKKTYVLYKNSYKIDLDVSFDFKKQEKNVRPRIFMPAPFVGEIANDTASGFVINVDNKSINKLSKSQLTEAWVMPSIFGAEDKYFANSLVKDLDGFVQRGFYRQGDNTITSVLEGPEIKDKANFTLSFYVGPKLVDDLAKVDDRLEDLLSFGWLSWLCKLFLKFLEYLYSLLGNFGLAIILFAVITKIPFLPMTLSAKSKMDKYNKYQPTIQRIRLKYKSDLKRQQEEIVKFHKDHNLSPATPMLGCLPLLLQAPILFALYRVLSGYLGLYQAPFFGWITDLSSKDPYYILPGLMGCTMIWQQLSAPVKDPKQKMMMFFMPVVITVVFAGFPAGLVLYWLTNNLLMVSEEYLKRLFYK